jgi:acetoin utilization deacetylase AcuC-like enzyme
MSTCYAYDPIEQQHTLPGHPENRERLRSTLALLRQRGLLDRMDALPVEPIPLEYLHWVHPPRYVARVQALDEAGGGHLDPDTYVVPGSYQAALASAGALAGVVGAVAEGRARNGFSLMRPPGHHALADQGMGFCLFANAAIAARVAQRVHGLARVLIIDWDVHHGNGTEAIFYDDPTVAFFSTHQYPLYPGTGAAEDIGRGPGRGATMNVPLPPGVGDAGYLRVFDELLTPFARRFRPDIILLSAGYDAHWQDPLASENLSLLGFAQLAARVRDLAEELCDGRLVATLEGGYHLQALSHGVMNTLLAFMGEEAGAEDPLGPPAYARNEVDDLIARIRSLHGLD